MDRRLGMEGMRGLGGGIVSKESQDDLEKGEYLFRKKKYTEAKIYFQKAMKDPNNLDADIRMASLLDARLSITYLEAAQVRGREILRRILGNDCFDEDAGTVGHFWGIIETRPYMRLLQALLETYTEARKYAKAADMAIELLRLCPNDNGGHRFWTGTVLIHSGRYADALYFCQQWLSDKSIGTGESPPRGGTTFKAPHRNTMAVKKEKNYRGVAAPLLYSAALASFKHFGDCEQSRQYLKLSAIALPNVLVKILAKVQKPDNFASNLRLRSQNGPEDAQDYLWYAQDLWMDPEVWNWANDNRDVKTAVLKKCTHPICKNVESTVAEHKRCSACHLVSYCSPACQQANWRDHKPACLAHKREKDGNRAFLLGNPPSGI